MFCGKQAENPLELNGATESVYNPEKANKQRKAAMIVMFISWAFLVVSTIISILNWGWDFSVYQLSYICFCVLSTVSILLMVKKNEGKISTILLSIGIGIYSAPNLYDFISVIDDINISNFHTGIIGFLYCIAPILLFVQVLTDKKGFGIAAIVSTSIYVLFFFSCIDYDISYLKYALYHITVNAAPIPMIISIFIVLSTRKHFRQKEAN